MLSLYAIIFNFFSKSLSIAAWTLLFFLIIMWEGSIRKQIAVCKIFISIIAHLNLVRIFIIIRYTIVITCCAYCYGLLCQSKVSSLCCFFPHNGMQASHIHRYPGTCFSRHGASTRPCLTFMLNLKMAAARWVGPGCCR